MTHLKHERYSAVIGCIVFVISWIYCVMQYGYLFGVGLGWLPSLIVAFIARCIWVFIFYGSIFAILLFVLFAAGVPQQVREFIVEFKGLPFDKWVSLFFVVSIVCFLIFHFASRVNLKNKSIIYWMGLLYGKVRLKIKSYHYVIRCSL